MYRRTKAIWKYIFCFATLFMAICFFSTPIRAQEKSSTPITADSGMNTIRHKAADTLQKKKTDTAVVRKKKKPQAIAAMRSAIFPGLGQIYNKKYWKLPIVYGALAIPTYTFFYNLKWYKEARFAYTVKYNSSLNPPDSTGYDQIDPRLEPLSLESLRFYRNDFRRNMDYSVLAFLFIWGLQVVDATVDAHMKGFNVNDDLTLYIKPGHSAFANTDGISIVLQIGRSSKYHSFSNN